MFALVMYGERATAPATSRARPAKNKAENRLTREMVFVLRWKICAISLFALQGERTSRTRSSDAPPIQKARAWNNGNLYLPIKDMRMQTRIAPRNTRCESCCFSQLEFLEIAKMRKGLYCRAPRIFPLAGSRAGHYTGGEPLEPSRGPGTARQAECFT